MTKIGAQTSRPWVSNVFFLVPDGRFYATWTKIIERVPAPLGKGDPAGLVNVPWV